jgi:rod shape determining protein RodA
MATTSASLDKPISMQRTAAGLVEWYIVLCALGLCCMGLASIYSATFNAGMPSYFYKQLIFAGVGVAVGVGLALLPSRWLEVTSWLWYGVGIALLVAVLLVGKVVNGQKNWIVLAGLSFQPSEVAKITTLLAMARFIARPNVNLQALRDFLTVFALVAVPFALVILEPDFGSATVFAGLFLGVALWCGADAMLLFACVAPGAVAIAALFGQIPLYISLVVVAVCTLLFRRGTVVTLVVILMSIGIGYGTPWAVNNILKPHQKARVEIFLNPDKDPRGQGYNVVQSTMAVGSGGIWGKGFQHGTQTQLRYIPKQWTDFIYCVPTEEFGFVGGTLVIALLVGLCVRTVRVASLIRNKFESVIAIGVASLWFYHGAVNIGMAIGLLPVIGIPLPFMSAGGTSLVINMAMAGMVLGFYRQLRKRVDSAVVNE